MKKLLFGFLLIIAALLLVAFFSLNFIVKKAVNTYGPRIAKVAVHLGGADLSPFSGSGKLSNLLIGNPEGYKTPSAILLGSIKARTEPRALFSDPIIVNEIAIQSPEITLEGTPFGNNLGKLLENLKGTSSEDSTATTADPSKSKKFIVKEITISGAVLHISVSAANQSFNQDLTLPDIHIENVGTAEGGVTGGQLAQQILTPLINSAIRSGMAPLIQQGLKGLKIQGADQLNKVLGNFLK